MFLTAKVSFVNQQQVLHVTQQQGHWQLYGYYLLFQAFYFYSYYRLRLPSMYPVSFIDNNTGMYCTQKENKHYFNYFSCRSFRAQ